MEMLLIAAMVLIALAFALVPLFRRDARDSGYDDADLDADVARYRAALRDGTVCARCIEANPRGSRYCMRCGRRLTRREADAA